MGFRRVGTRSEEKSSIRPRVPFLDEKPSLHLLEIDPACGTGQIRPDVQQAQGRLLREDREGRGVESGRDDDLGEQARHLRRRLLVDLPVEGDHAPEGGNGVRGLRLPVGLDEPGARRDAARIVVLDDRGRRRVELQHEGQRRVGVQNVVEGELLALKRAGGGDGGRGRRHVAVERGPLMGILP